MTSTLMNNAKDTGSISETMQRMITPQYEQIVNEIETIYHHPETGSLFSALFLLIRCHLSRTYHNCSMA